MSVEVEDINLLGDIINTTWGKTSSPSTTHHISIKASILNESTMMFQYSTIVNFHSYMNTLPQQMSHKEDGVKVINECLKFVKSKFNEESDKDIKFEEKLVEDSVEMIHSQPYINAKKTAFYRVWAHFDFEIK